MWTKPQLKTVKKDNIFEGPNCKKDDFLSLVSNFSSADALGL